MLGEKLKVAREKKNLSQNDVASVLNISRQSISKWENNRNTPDIDNLIRLCNLYDVTLDELISGYDESKNNNVPSEYLNQKTTIENLEWLLLIILCIVSTFAAPLGLLTAPFILIKNKNNAQHRLFIIVLCILCILINIYHIYMIYTDYHNFGQEINIEKIE